MVVLICLAVFAVFAVAILLSGLILMVLWNVVAPVFGGPHISYWTAVCGSLLVGFIGSAFRTQQVTTRRH